MLLTEQEVDALRKSLPAVCKHQDVIRAAESAVLEKLKAQEPVAWVCVNEDGECEQIDFGKESPLPEDEGFKPLYANPLPPNDVVRDAERYKFIKSGNVDVEYDGESMIITSCENQWIVPPFADFDAAIDAAMEKMK